MIRKFLIIYLLISTFASANEIRWIQVETLPSIIRAEESTKQFSKVLSEKINIFSIDDGWYAVSLGPYNAEQAFEVLNTKLATGLISPDSFVTDGANYGGKIWTTGSFVMEDLEKLSNNESAEYNQNYEFDLNDNQLLASESNNLTFSNLEQLGSLERAKFFDSQLSGFYKKAVQAALFSEGVYDSAIDGQYGPGTRRAIADWQIDNNFEATGYMSIPQQSKLIKGYLEPLFETGIRTERNILAGIKIPLPTDFRKPTEISPPFVTYEATSSSKIKIFLISQHGDEYDFKILFKAMEDLEIIPIDAKRVLLRNSFEFSGKNNEFESFFTAVSANNKVKGFGIVWPSEEDFTAKRLLVKMRLEFESIPGALSKKIGSNDDQNLTERLGFKLRRPQYSRSGLFIDNEAKVITQLSGLSACSRLTVNGVYDYGIFLENNDLDVAILIPKKVLKPLGIIQYTSTKPTIGEKISLVSFPYQGKLKRPTLTEGIFKEMVDLTGNKNKFRFSLHVQPGDSGGGIFDSSGNFIGLHLDYINEKKNSDAQIAIKAQAINNFLLELNASELKRSYRTEPLDLGKIESMANKVTALVSCWDKE
jgi:S1-C subfamily serine protease